jgi:hypothetical protein
LLAAAAVRIYPHLQVNVEIESGLFIVAVVVVVQ